ncbi:MAG TPA: hypothetical protein PKI46_04255, partial [Bacteroidales bacterium]|nr:hypothetical protein [Bacteroidales bacterium]
SSPSINKPPPSPRVINTSTRSSSPSINKPPPSPRVINTSTRSSSPSILSEMTNPLNTVKTSTISSTSSIKNDPWIDEIDDVKAYTLYKNYWLHDNKNMIIVDDMIEISNLYLLTYKHIYSKHKDLATKICGSIVPNIHVKVSTYDEIYDEVGINIYDGKKIILCVDFFDIRYNINNDEEIELLRLEQDNKLKNTKKIKLETYNYDNEISKSYDESVKVTYCNDDGIVVTKWDYDELYILKYRGSPTLEEKEKDKNILEARNKISKEKKKQERIENRPEKKFHQKTLNKNMQIKEESDKIISDCNKIIENNKNSCRYTSLGLIIPNVGKNKH